MFDRPNKHIKESMDLIKRINTEKDKEVQSKLHKEYLKGNAKRLFLGKDFDGLVKLALYNKNGEESIKLFIDEDDNPKILIKGKEINLEDILK